MSDIILVANASEARLFTSENLRTKPLELVQDLSHPESRQKGVDLISDRPGHYQVGSSARSSYEKSKPKEVEAERFMCELAPMLKTRLDQISHGLVVLVIPSHVYGVFKKHFHGHDNNWEHIGKDYTKCKQDELLQLIRQHIFI